MPKLKETIGGATLEIDADEAGCVEAVRMFHLAVAEQELRAVERRLALLKPLQKNRRELVDLIAKLRRKPEGTM
ncbi:MAG: hypothetical protein NUW01_18630 [Gemmatimonadaceae bacterium]|nr:hypothetical protein [Gemmatimonadaceae bacterium]